MTSGSTPEGYTLVATGGGGVRWEIGAPQRAGTIGWMIPAVNEAGDTEHQIFSHRGLAPELLNDPINPVTSQIHFASDFTQVEVDVGVLNAAGTLRLSGTAWDPNSCAPFPGTTVETFPINALGVYTSTYHWSGNVTMDTPDTLDVVVTTETWAPHLAGKDWTLNHIGLWWRATSANNRLQVIADKFVPLTGFVGILDETVINIPNGEIGHIDCDSLAADIVESAGQRFRLRVNTKGITDVRFEITE
jgi:hypothetical protein